MAESVLCCKRELLPREFTGKKISISKNLKTVMDVMEAASPDFVERNNAEYNVDLKQIIPYILVKDKEIEGRFLFYKRRGSESRLHGLWSGGVGGHINPVDYGKTLEETIYNCVRRELKEELGMADFEKSITFLGIINEELTKVGKVHIGLVFVCSLFGKDNFSFGDEVSNYAFSKYSSMKARDEKFELWTELAMELL